jgi:arsenate reductase
MRIQHLIIVCSSADGECPRIFPGVLNRHFMPFDDPAALEGSNVEVMAGFRRIRNEIRSQLETWLESA